MVTQIQLEVDLGQTLLMLRRAYGLLNKRTSELANCRSCSEQEKQGILQSVGVCATLMQQIQEQADGNS